MNDTASSSFQSNPFATRFTRPGEIAFRFLEGESLDDIVKRLQHVGWHGALVGPHGSGKTTLLAALIPCLKGVGKTPLIISLHDGEHKLPEKLSGSHLEPNTIIVVDGYEQLSFWHRWRLRWNCRRRKWGLLVTSHRPLEMPTLYRTEPRLETVQEIVADLLPPGDRSIIPSEVSEAFARHGGNVRETLFELYDRYYQKHLCQPSSDSMRNRNDKRTTLTIE